MTPARAIILLAFTLAPALAHAGAGESVPPSDPIEIYGGQLAGTCQWPSAVAIWGNDTSCTGSLVHPEIIVTAAHCLESGPLTAAGFGEDSWTPEREVAIADCVQHPNYPLEYPDYADFMYCRLAQPVLDVPIVPILMGCEAEAIAPGASVVIAGYGLTNDGGPEGMKRYVTSTVDRLEETRVFYASGTCNGDSGGPAYVEVEGEGWRLVSTTTGGEVCGGWSQSELIHHFVGWIEDDSGLDITPCHDADGTWAPTAACGGFPAEPDVAHGSWMSGCEGSVTDPSATCGAAFGEEEGDTDDGESGLPPADDDAGDLSESSESGEDEDPDGGDDDDDGLPPSTGAPPTTPPANGKDDPKGCRVGGSEGSAFALGLIVLIAIRRRPARARARARRSAIPYGSRS